MAAGGYDACKIRQNLPNYNTQLIRLAEAVSHSIILPRWLHRLGGIAYRSRRLKMWGRLPIADLRQFRQVGNLPHMP
jgi:hypothetical protein